MFPRNGPGNIRSFPSWHYEIAAQPTLVAVHRTPFHHHSFGLTHKQRWLKGFRQTTTLRKMGVRQTGGHWSSRCWE